MFNRQPDPILRPNDTKNTRISVRFWSVVWIVVLPLIGLVDNFFSLSDRALTEVQRSRNKNGESSESVRQLREYNEKQESIRQLRNQQGLEPNPLFRSTNFEKPEKAEKQ